ncbi:hypothetical protein AB4Y69_11035 [Bacillus sp. YAF8]|uniref:hypothetical protein n=1 Tax=Bacillus TaxID=1386 RepID=UPI003458089C
MGIYRGKGGTVSNNSFEKIKASSIATHQAEDFLITDNRIENSDCVQVQVRNSNDIKVRNRNELIICCKDNGF